MRALARARRVMKWNVRYWYYVRVRIVFRLAIRAPGGLLVSRRTSPGTANPNRKGFELYVRCD